MLKCTSFAEVSRYKLPGYSGNLDPLVIRQVLMTLSSSTPHHPDDSIYYHEWGHSHTTC